MVVLIVGLIVSRVVSTNSRSAEPEVKISAYEASEHIGTIAEVCGVVASADFLPSVNGQPTFLNLEEAHPNQIFTAVIFGEDRPRFRFRPEEEYTGRPVCVTGMIQMHQGTPQIIISRPEQISTSERMELQEGSRI